MKTRHLQIRQLRPGEALPLGEPKRYKSSHGYVRLRWRVGLDSYVEVYEHRLVAGFPPGHVHHANHVKDDNAPGNLVPLSASEHLMRHVKFDVAEAIRLYQAGATLPQLSVIFHRDHGGLSRLFRRRGVQMRDSGCGRRLAIDADRVRDLHIAGWSAPEIGARLGVTAHPVRRVVRDLGLAPHRVGRRPGRTKAA